MDLSNEGDFGLPGTTNVLAQKLERSTTRAPGPIIGRSLSTSLVNINQTHALSSYIKIDKKQYFSKYELLTSIFIFNVFFYIGKIDLKPKFWFFEKSSFYQLFHILNQLKFILDDCFDIPNWYFNSPKKLIFEDFFRFFLSKSI